MTESRAERAPAAPDTAATAARDRALIERYFDCVTRGDPAVADLFADDVVWRTPQSSPMPGPFEGRAAVLELMGAGVGLYASDPPLAIEPLAIAADGGRVFVELELTAQTAAGAPYRNQYVFVFRIEGDRIVEVHEHLDTLYAQRLLFDPAGQRSPLDEGGA